MFSRLRPLRPSLARVSRHQRRLDGPGRLWGCRIRLLENSRDNRVFLFRSFLGQSPSEGGEMMPRAAGVLGKEGLRRRRIPGLGGVGIGPEMAVGLVEERLAERGELPGDMAPR